VQRVPHAAFMIVQLTQTVPQPVLRPVLLGIRIHMHTAELFLVAESEHEPIPLLRLLVDLRTDLPRRLRRRAAHRRRRRARGRYRAPRRQGIPHPLRRPSLARSTWSHHRQRPHLRGHRSSQAHVSPTLQWRAQAVRRVIDALRAWVPVSHVVILDPQPRQGYRPTDQSAAERRRQLIAAYGVTDSTGTPSAVCAYCGTTEPPIEVDHIRPRSRGGTDAWDNLALACAACNARKGDRTPAEAGMRLLEHHRQPAHPHRDSPYRRWTARLLVADLAATDLVVAWPAASAPSTPRIAPALAATLQAVADDPGTLPLVVARPVARPRKQRFSARNYPATTPLHRGMAHVGRTIKRRVRVNQGLWVRREGRRVTVEVVSMETPGTPLPSRPGQWITHGMLCAGQRAGRQVVGMVTAIHSSGRITLLTLQSAESAIIRWQPVVVSPRQDLRILSTDRVIFLPVGRDPQDTAQLPEEQHNA